MSGSRDFLVFLQDLHAEIIDRATAADDETAYRQNAFTSYILEFFEEAGIVANSRAVFLETRVGRGSAKVNGYAIGDEEDTLDIFTTLYQDADRPVTVSRTDVRQAAEQATRFLVGAFDGLAARLEASSEEAAMTTHVADVCDKLTAVRIFLLTDGLTPTCKTLEETELEGKRVRFEVWDSERLYRAMQAGRPRAEIVIDFAEDYGGPLPCLEVPRGERDYSGYLALIPGGVIYQLYDDFSSALLELNVRSFLSARGKVNSGIRGTLKEAPGRFMAYNNGVVMTADELEVGRMPDGQTAIMKARGLQIVNGGQTTASIHRAKKEDKSDIGSVFVPAKIVVIDPDEQDAFVRNVSRFANTQNVIQIADFSANEPYHVELERLSKVIWCPGEQGRWFYERARGQYQVEKNKAPAGPRRRVFEAQTPPARRFVKVEIAKYEQSWAQKPYSVSFGAQKNFDIFMQDMRARQKDWLPDDIYYRNLIAKAILFRNIERVVRQEGFRKDRPQITTYVMSYLVHRASNQIDLDLIWRTQTLTDELEAMLRAWSHPIADKLIQSADGRLVSEWCKKEACWRAIRDLNLPLPDTLPQEIGGTSRGDASPPHTDEQATSEDLENMALCRKATGETWLAVYGWGRKTGALKTWETGIARTLSAYAAQGWPTGISVKQARHGVRILALARAGGALKTDQDHAM